MKRPKFVKTPLTVGLQETDVTNLLFLRLIFTSKNDCEPFSSVSDVSFMFLCFLFR